MSGLKAGMLRNFTDGRSDMSSAPCGCRNSGLRMVWINARDACMSRWAGLALAGWLMTGIVDSAWAQPGRGKAGGPKGQPGRSMPGGPGMGMPGAPGMGPGMGMPAAGGHGMPGGAGGPMPGAGMPGMAPGMGPGMGMPGAGGSAAKGDGRRPLKDLNVLKSDPSDPATLPPGFQPLAEEHELIQLDLPLLTAQQLADLRKIEDKYKKALNKGVLDDAAKKLIRDGVRYRLAQLTVKENREKKLNLHELREMLLRDLQFAGKLLDKPDEVRTFRGFVLQEIVAQAAPLLQNNLYVRLQIVILLGELNLTDEDPRRNLQTVAFAPAAAPLAEVLRDAKQPEALKVAAVRSLTRVLRMSAPDVVLKLQIAQTLVDEFSADRSTHWWYQMRLAEALASVDVAKDRNQKPFVVSALTSAVVDSQRHWLVRAESARSLGRVPFDASVDIPQVMGAIGVLALDLTKGQIERPQDDLYWRPAFTRLYLAFQASDPTDRDALKKNPGGLLGNSTTANQSKELYSLVIPICRNVLRNEPVSSDAMKSLQDWVDRRRPASSTTTPVAQQGRPLTSTEK